MNEIQTAAGLTFTTTNVGFSPADLFDSAVSLLGPFWPFVLLGLAFVVAPWLISLLVSSVKKARASKAS